MYSRIFVTSFAIACLVASTILVGLFASPAQSGESPGAPAVEEIRRVMIAQQEAWNKGDIEGFMEGYARSNETVFVSGDEVTRGWQTVNER